jgi:hypothetical protein
MQVSIWKISEQSLVTVASRLRPPTFGECGLMRAEGAHRFRKPAIRSITAAWPFLSRLLQWSTL